ncbi:hypothetical protein J6590_019340 [Homalodisca vitripennis]|nr:hypothetical protein J6590_019340 [Homalodisca vitripennis]
MKTRVSSGDADLWKPSTTPAQYTSKENDQNNRQHELQRLVPTSVQDIAAVDSAMYLLSWKQFYSVSYSVRGRYNYRTERDRTVVYEHLPSQAGVRIRQIARFDKKRTNTQDFKNLFEALFSVQGIL